MMSCTCQLSRLKRESHACGLKTSISRQLMPAGQFLTPDWKMWVVAILLDTISKNMFTQTHVRNENHVKNEKMTIPSSRFLIFEVKSTGSKLAFIRLFGRLRTTSENFGVLRKWLCRLQKSQHSQDKNLMLISQKKLAGILSCHNNEIAWAIVLPSGVDLWACSGHCQL